MKIDLVLGLTQCDEFHGDAHKCVYTPGKGVTYTAKAARLILMKRVFVYIILTCLLANTSVVSAWAKPMVGEMTISSSLSDMDVMENTLPCHEMDKVLQTDRNHCESLCFCAHVSSHSAAFLNSFNEIDSFITTKARFAIVDDASPSLNPIPPERPPKHVS